MAQVDFSHAVLDVYDNIYPMQSAYLFLNLSPYFADANSRSITSGSTLTKLTDTPSKVSLLFTGTFTASGTEFYTTTGDMAYKRWKVSNISFSNGDTFSFIIDIETSGNT